MLYNPDSSFEQYLNCKIRLTIYHMNNRICVYNGTLVHVGKLDLIILSSYSKKKRLISKPRNVKYNIELLDHVQ